MLVNYSFSISLVFALVFRVIGTVDDCALLFDLFPNGSQENNAANFELFIDHEFLTVKQGFVPGETYQVTVAGTEGRYFDSYVVVAFNSLGKRFLGKLTDGEAAESGVHNCGPGNDSVALVDNQAKVARQKMRFRWTAPSRISNDTGCLILVVVISRQYGRNSAYLTQKLCRNPGCYHIERGLSGTFNLSAVPTQRCWIALVTPEAHNVYVQVDKLRIATPAKDCSSNVSLSLHANEQDFVYNMLPLPCDAANISAEPERFFFRGYNNFMLLRYFVEAGTHLLQIQLRYYGLLKIVGCNETITDIASGSLNSPGYPDKYYPNLDCYYHIMAPPGDRIQFRLVDVSLEGDGVTNLQLSGQSKCPRDYIEVLDGLENLFRWCGFWPSSTLQAFSAFQSSTDYVIFRFRSDHLIEAQGFLIAWSTVTSCRNDTITATEGHITSPGYPNYYLNNQECTYTIRVPEGHIVQLTFTQFHLEPLHHNTQVCLADWLEVNDERLCGSWVNKMDLLHFYSGSPDMNITFHTNAAMTGPGFVAEFKAVPPNKSHECAKHLAAFEDFCFEVVFKDMSWYEAADECRLRGGWLASVTSAPLQAFLDKLLAKESTPTWFGVWIGASDMKFETNFAWIDNARLDYTNWFRGWPDFQFFNAQPSDDGLSEQDCVEMRRNFSYPSKGYGLTDMYFWNDRNCASKNAHMCQFWRPGVEFPDTSPDEKGCNATVHLSATTWHATISSPRFPDTYLDFQDCYTRILVPENSLVTIEFTTFVLENHENCNYDYLEITEIGTPEEEPAQVRCGNWSGRLKLLTVESIAPEVALHFHTDHSRGYAGFLANVYLSQNETGNMCNNLKMKVFRKNCYQIAFEPLVSWQSAKQVCESNWAQLAIIRDFREASFLYSSIIQHPMYTTSSWLWLGGYQNSSMWRWISGAKLDFADWFPGASKAFVPPEPNLRLTDGCLAVQQSFHKAKNFLHPIWTAERHYWASKSCTEAAGFICKSDIPPITVGQSLVFNRSESRGVLHLPGYTKFPYPNRFDYTLHIQSPPDTRILITFQELAIEYQEQCLYDYVSLATFPNEKPERYCGQPSAGMLPEFVSKSNMATLHFKSDYSTVDKGFLARYQVVNISDCYTDISAAEGVLTSVNFPDFYLNLLQCNATIRASNVKQRIALDFIHFQVGEVKDADSLCLNTDYVTVRLDGEVGSRYKRLCGELNTMGTSIGLIMVSYGPQMQVQFSSDSSKTNVGYKARHSTVQPNTTLSRTLNLTENSTFHLQSINYPFPYPDNLCYRLLFRVPYGYQLRVDFFELFIPPIIDDEFTLLLDDSKFLLNEHIQNYTHVSMWNRLAVQFCSVSQRPEHEHLKRYSGLVSVQEDKEFWKGKAVANNTGYVGIVENCETDICKNGGKCKRTPSGASCICSAAYLGAFCHWSYCDFVKPCVHGRCVIAAGQQFHCQCELGYTGSRCETKIRPCASNPCVNGECLEKMVTFVCLCHEGYRGELCATIDLFNARTLRESFLRDPFWLGLFMVLGSMAIVGIVHSFRRRYNEGHFTHIIQKIPSCITRWFLPNTEGDQSAKVLVNALEGAEVINDEEYDSDDEEVHVKLAQLGIDTSQYGSLDLGDVSFKIRLSDLTEDQLIVLEEYLENYIKLYEGNTDESIQLQQMEDKTVAPVRRSRTVGELHELKLQKRRATDYSVSSPNEYQDVAQIIMMAAQVISKPALQVSISDCGSLMPACGNQQSSSRRQSRFTDFFGSPQSRFRQAARQAFRKLTRPTSVGAVLDADEIEMTETERMMVVSTESPPDSPCLDDMHKLV